MYATARLLRGTVFGLYDRGNTGLAEAATPKSRRVLHHAVSEHVDGTVLELAAARQAEPLKPDAERLFAKHRLHNDRAPLQLISHFRLGDHVAVEVDQSGKSIAPLTPSGSSPSAASSTPPLSMSQPARALLDGAVPHEIVAMGLRVPLDEGSFDALPAWIRNAACLAAAVRTRLCRALSQSRRDAAAGSRRHPAEADSHTTSSKDGIVPYLDQAHTLPASWTASLPTHQEHDGLMAMSCSRTAHAASLLLLADATLVEEHPFHEITAVDAEAWEPVVDMHTSGLVDEGGDQGAYTLSAQFDSEMHRLHQALGPVEWASTRRWMATAALRALMVPSTKDSFSSNLRAAWVQEEMRSVVWRTGIDQATRSEAHSPRSDVKRTAKRQGQGATVAIAELLQRLLVAAPDRHLRVQLECDKTFLFVELSSNKKLLGHDKDEEEDGSPGQPQHRSTSLSAVVPTAAPSSSVVTTRSNRAVPLQTVEAILERRGVPHRLVEELLGKELARLRRSDSRRFVARTRDATAASGLPPVSLSVRSVTEAASIGVQRVRFHNTHIDHVHELASQLRSGWLANPTHQGGREVSRREKTDAFYRSFCEEAAREPWRKLVVRKDGLLSIDTRVRWKRNAAAMHAAKDYGFVRLSRRDQNFGRGSGTRRSGVGHTLRDLQRTKEEVDYWTTHGVQLSHAVEVPSPCDRIKRTTTEEEETEDKQQYHALQIGDLWGFQYRTVLRAVRAVDREQMEAAVDSVRRDGFLNYFGPSRFSDLARRQLHPGLHLLRGEFRAAAHLLIDVGESGDFESVDLEEARFDGVRRRLLALLRSTADGGASEEGCRAAFVDGLGLATCKSLVHESLTLMWNEALSRRVHLGGTRRLLEGDIVRPRTISDGAPDEAELGSANSLVEPTTASGEEPTFATSEGIAEGRYTIADLVLPIPGAGVVLPRNPIATFYKKALEAHGVHLHPEHRFWPSFLRESNPLGFEFLGGYRRAIERPRDLTLVWEHDHLRDGESAEQRRRLRRAGATWAREADLAACLTYRLPASAYASSMLRELAGSNVVSSEDYREVDPYAEGRVPLPQLSKQQQDDFKRMSQRSRVMPHGTERLAMAKIEAQIFTSGGTHALLPPPLHHRRGAMDQLRR